MVYEAIKRGIGIDEIFNITKIDRWFLYKLKNLIEMEQDISCGELTQEKYKNRGPAQCGRHLAAAGAPDAVGSRGRLARTVA